MLSPQRKQDLKKEGESFISGQTGGERAAASLGTFLKTQRGEAGNIWEILAQT